MTGKVLLFAFSVTGPLLCRRRSSLFCCDAECVAKDELVVFILLAIVVKAIFDDRYRW